MRPKPTKGCRASEEEEEEEDMFEITSPVSVRMFMTLFNSD
jgi:hypothetical protein